MSLLCRFQGMGFERGWGDTAQRVLEMIHLLLDILQAPDPSTLETFLGRIPMVFNVVILSPHGYFGQANVLGLPDTGGQVLTFFHCGEPIIFLMLQWILFPFFPVFIWSSFSCSCKAYVTYMIINFYV